MEEMHDFGFYEEDDNSNHKKGLSDECEKDYEDYFSEVLIKEEPFYRSGMTVEEARIEIDYLNRNLENFFEGIYVPLWRQHIWDEYLK